MPPTIQALLAARLDRLSGTEQAVVGAASVVGKEFWRAAVVALSRKHDPSRIDQALATLERKQLIGPEESSFTGEQGFAFRHILIRDAAYDALMKSTRADLHETFGSWLEDGFPQRMVELEAILGFHFEQAYGYRAELSPADGRHRELAERAATRLASAGRRLRTCARGRDGGEPPRAGEQTLSRRHARAALAAATRRRGARGDGESRACGRALRARRSKGRRAAGERAGRGPRPRMGVRTSGSSRIRRSAAKRSSPRRSGRSRSSRRSATSAASPRRGGSSARHAPIRAGPAEGSEALERALTHVTPETAPELERAAVRDRHVPARRSRSARRGGRLREGAAGRLRGRGAARRSRRTCCTSWERPRGGRDTSSPAARALDSSAAISEELGLAYMAQWSRRSLGRLELAARRSGGGRAGAPGEPEVLIEMGLIGSLGETVVPLAEALYAQGRYDEATETLKSVKEEWASGDASIDAPRLALEGEATGGRGAGRPGRARRRSRALRLVERTDWACLQADTLLAQAEILRLADRLAEAVPSLRSELRIAGAKGYAVAAAGARRRLLESSASERPEQVATPSGLSIGPAGRPPGAAPGRLPRGRRLGGAAARRRVRLCGRGRNGGRPRGDGRAAVARGLARGEGRRSAGGGTPRAGDAARGAKRSRLLASASRRCAAGTPTARPPRRGDRGSARPRGRRPASDRRSRFGRGQRSPPCSSSAARGACAPMPPRPPCWRRPAPAQRRRWSRSTSGSPRRMSAWPRRGLSPTRPRPPASGRSRAFPRHQAAKKHTQPGKIPPLPPVWWS